VTPAGAAALYETGRPLRGAGRAGGPGTLCGAATHEEDTVARAGARRRAGADGGGLGRAVARARAGDEAAFTAVYREVQPLLLGYLRGLVGDVAEDVASDTWRDIVRDLGAFRGDGAAFRGWVARVARYRALAHLRWLASRPCGDPDGPAAAGPAEPTEDPATLVAEPAAAPDSAGSAQDRLSTARALAMIAGLPREQAEAVLLRAVIGLSGPAAADILGKRPGAVRTAAHRGLRRLAEQLGDAARDARPPAGAGQHDAGDTARMDDTARMEDTGRTQDMGEPGGHGEQGGQKEQGRGGAGAMAADDTGEV
jgi:RNA polymerase sigma factor (sigma-70 family)